MNNPDKQMPEEIFVDNEDDFVERNGKMLDMDKWTKYVRADLVENTKDKSK